MTGIIKTDQIQGAQSTTVTVPTGHTLAVTSNATVGGTFNVNGAFTSQGIDDNADAIAIKIDASEKVSLGGSTAVTSDSKVAIHGGNLELTTAGARYWIPRASDGALTGSLYSPSGSVVRLSGAGTGSGTIEFEPRSSNGVIARVTGDGLCFGSDTAAANALNDYEEGTFTPNFIGSGDNYGATHTFRFGQYTKIGDTVYFTLRCASSSVNSTSDQVYISGLPFSANYGNSGISDGFAVVGNGMKIDFGVGYVYGNMTNTNTVITLLMQGYNVGSGAGIDNFRQHDMYASHDVRISGFYKTTS